MAKTNERVPFRLIHMECCGQLLCWINPRLPTHCPECGRCCYPAVRGWVQFSDDNAHIKYSVPDHTVYENTPEKAQGIGWLAVPEYCKGDPNAAYVIHDHGKGYFYYSDSRVPTARICNGCGLAVVTLPNKYCANCGGIDWSNTVATTT